VPRAFCEFINLRHCVKPGTVVDRCEFNHLDTAGCVRVSVGMSNAPGLPTIVASSQLSSTAMQMHVIHVATRGCEVGVCLTLRMTVRCEDWTEPIFAKTDVMQIFTTIIYRSCTGFTCRCHCLRTGDLRTTNVFQRFVLLTIHEQFSMSY
jgi:hypothetical protein